MTDEITITDGPGDLEAGADSAAAADAARAQASASAASEAAALALVTADAAAAAAEADAAATVADHEGRLSECLERLQNVTQQQAALSGEAADLRSQMGTMEQSLQLILARLPPEPESQASQEPGPGEEGRPAAEPDLAPAQEPDPPAKRRPHRWI